MAITFAKLREERLAVPVTVGDETLTLTINARAVTPRFMKQWQNGGGEPDQMEQGIKLIEHCVVDCDLVGEDGKPLKLTRQLLEQIDIRLLNAMATAVSEAIFPNAPSSPS